MAHRASPNAIQYPLMVPTNSTDVINNQFFLDLTSKRPVVIVDMDYDKSLSLDPQKRAIQIANHEEWPYLPSNINEVLNFIDNNYHLEATFRNAVVYRLNGDNP